MIKIDHVAILVKRIDKAAEFYRDTFGCGSAKVFELNESSSKIKYALLPIEQNYIELIEPVNGILKDIMETEGEGYLYEVCFEVDDIERFCNKMRERGIALIDINGVPLGDRKILSAPSGNKYVYLSQKNTFGTRIEILERVADKGSTE